MDYLWLKALHVVGAVLFLGNYVFTLGGVLIVLGTVLANVYLHGLSYAADPWLAWGTGLFVASGVIWVLILVPLQAKLGRLARGFAADGTMVFKGAA